MGSYNSGLHCLLVQSIVFVGTTGCRRRRQEGHEGCRQFGPGNHTMTIGIFIELALVIVLPSRARCVRPDAIRV